MLIFQSKNFILSYFNNCYRLLNRDDKAAAATDKPVLITNGGQGLMEKGNKKNLIFQVIRNGMGLKAKNVDNIGMDKKEKKKNLQEGR